MSDWSFHEEKWLQHVFCASPQSFVTLRFLCADVFIWKRHRPGDTQRGVSQSSSVLHIGLNAIHDS